MESSEYGGVSAIPLFLRLIIICFQHKNTLHADILTRSNQNMHDKAPCRSSFYSILFFESLLPRMFIDYALNQPLGGLVKAIRS